MRVGFELTALQVNQGGVSRYIRGQREALARRDDVDLVDLAQPAAWGRSPATRGIAREACWMPFGLERAARRRRVDLVHCPAHLAPPRRTRPPVILTVYDVLPLAHPEWFTRRNAAHVRLLLGRMARSAVGVITASASTRVDLLDAVPGLDPARVVTVHGGVDAIFSPGPGPRRERPYVLTVGSLQPRKNAEAAIAAYERIAAAHPDHDLVVVAAAAWRHAGLEERVRSSPVGDRIELVGDVADADLVTLYRGAACFVFPSRGEGFGLPPLEAMACGAPVVCSDRTSLPEVVGDAGLLADPDDREALAAALEQVLARPERAAELSAAGLRRASEFSWERSAEATVAAYRTLAAQGRW